jgi:hypothetical protein
VAPIDWEKAYTAVTGHLTANTLKKLTLAQRKCKGGAVSVGVAVNKTRRYDEVPNINRPSVILIQLVTHFCNNTVRYCYVGAKSRPACAIDNGSSPQNDTIAHLFHLVFYLKGQVSNPDDTA